MYFVAFAAVAVGLVVYSGFDKENHGEVVDEVEERSRYLDEEVGGLSSNKSYVAIGSSSSNSSSNSNKDVSASTSERKTGSNTQIKKIWSWRLFLQKKKNAFWWLAILIV